MTKLTAQKASGWPTVGYSGDSPGKHCPVLTPSNTICAGQEHAGLVRSVTSLPVTENSDKESAAQTPENFHFIQPRARFSPLCC